MNSEVWVIYSKDILNTKQFSKAIYTPQIQATPYLMLKQFNSEGKKITYVIRGLHENFTMKLEFSFL